MPLLNNMTDDTGEAVSEKELDATMKVVELSHYLYEICMMKDQMMNMKENPMEYAVEPMEPSVNNPRKAY